jgi:hypothetical protein
MGQGNIKCLCCRGKENNEIQFDGTENQQKTNDKSPNTIRNENSKDLKTYVNSKNIKSDSISNEEISKKEDDDDDNIIGESDAKKKKTNILQLRSFKKK